MAYLLGRLTYFLVIFDNIASFRNIDFTGRSHIGHVNYCLIRRQIDSGLNYSRNQSIRVLWANSNPWFDSDEESEDDSFNTSKYDYQTNRRLRRSWLARRNKYNYDHEKRLLSSWVESSSESSSGESSSGESSSDESSDESSSWDETYSEKNSGRKRRDYDRDIEYYYGEEAEESDVELSIPENIEEDYLDRVYEPSWEYGCHVKNYKIEELDRDKFKMETWPENTYLRVKLQSADRNAINIAIHKIRNAINSIESLKLVSVKSIPKKINRFLIMCAPTIDKRSKDHYEIQHHTRILDIYPQEGIDVSSKFSQLLLIPMPDEVKYEVWFQEVTAPKKSKFIHSQYPRRWISRYYIYNRDRNGKIETINQLLEKGNREFMPIRWPSNFYDLYKIPLPQLQSMLKRVKCKQDLAKQYEIFNIQRPAIDPLPDITDPIGLKLNVVHIGDDDE